MLYFAAHTLHMKIAVQHINTVHDFIGDNNAPSCFVSHNIRQRIVISVIGSYERRRRSFNLFYSRHKKHLSICTVG